MSTEKHQEPENDGVWLCGDRGVWTRYDPKEDKDLKFRLTKVLESTNVVALLGSGASVATNTNADKNGAPTMDELWAYVKKKIGDKIFEEVKSKMIGDNSEDNIELLLSMCKMQIDLLEVKSLKDDTEEERQKSINCLKFFVAKAEEEILNRVDFVSENTNLKFHIEFLRRLARRSADKPRAKIFTTNYDRCIEEASEKIGLVLVDGFSHSLVQKFNRDNFDYDLVRRSSVEKRVEYLDGVLHLYKLHGSIDWRRRQSDNAVIRSTKSDCDHIPILIYPRSSKYQEAFSHPYLDMFIAWQTALREPDTTLIISGFGFADDHVSAPIWSALESNLSMNLILFDPKLAVINSKSKKPESNNELNKYQKGILKLIEGGDTRITAICGSFEDLAMTVPEVLGRTERDQVKALISDALGRL